MFTTLDVFISQPMNGLTQEEINVTRERITKSLRETLGTSDNTEFRIINDLPKYDHMTRIDMLARSIGVIDNADIVIFASGFTKARGCLVEYHVVNEYGDDWVKDPKMPNVYFEMPDGTLKEATNRLERHRCFMMDQMND